MEPPPRKTDDNSAMATAMHDAFKTGPVEVKQRKTKVYWTSEEWLAVAREMRRQNPHLNFFASKFSIVDLGAVRAAQRAVLPLERRKIMAAQRGVQAPLVAAFKALRAELEGELEGDAEEVQEPAVAVTTDRPALQIVQPERVQEAPTPVAEIKTKAPSDIEENSFNAAVLNAAAPLVNLMVDEVVKRLLPQLSGMLIPELTKSISTMLQSSLAGITVASVPPSGMVEVTTPVVGQAVPQVSIRPSAKEMAAMFPTPEPKPKKPMIALLGPMGKQVNDIEQTFPQYRFVFIENGHGIKEAAADCELFIVYTSHFNSANKVAVKKYVPKTKMRQIAGSLSSVKHQIHAWQANL
jgi:hypothetical protein